MTPASVMKRLKAAGASLTSDFRRASLEMAWLRLCRITNESTETEICYACLNRELRWLWNSVYICLKVWTDTRTHRHTDRRRPARPIYYKLIHEFSAQVSLKKKKKKSDQIKYSFQIYAFLW